MFLTHGRLVYGQFPRKSHSCWAAPAIGGNWGSRNSSRISRLLRTRNRQCVSWASQIIMKKRQYVVINAVSYKGVTTHQGLNLVPWHGGVLCTVQFPKHSAFQKYVALMTQCFFKPFLRLAAFKRRLARCQRNIHRNYFLIKPEKEHVSVCARVRMRVQVCVSAILFGRGSKNVCKSASVCERV